MSLNLDAIRKKLSQLSGVSDKKKPKKFGPGEHKVRVLPWPDAEDGMPFKERLLYYNVGKQTIVSPESIGLPDPISEFRIQLFTEAKETGDANLKELGKRLMSKRVTLVAIIDRANEAAGPQLWSLNPLEAKELLGYFLDEEVGDFTDLKNGRDIKISVTPSNKSLPNGTRLNDTKLMPTMTKGPASSDSALVKNWMSNLPNVDEYFAILPYAEVKAKLETWLSEDKSPEKMQESEFKIKDKEETKDADKPSSLIQQAASAKKGSKKVTEVDDALDAALADLED